jgi:glycosyltransferase involved in cell wall biosynthesis
MTPHHVMTRLSSYFHVVWLERAHHWRETGSALARRREVAEQASRNGAAFEVYVPEPWLPDVYRAGALKRMLFGRRLKHGWDRLRRRGCTKLVLYLWRPEFEHALTRNEHDLSLYHIDDEYSFQENPPPTDERERRVIESADHVLAISPGLMERKGGINPSMWFVPEGVEYELYARPAREPDDLAGIPRPRIGYTGMLKRHLDWPLLRDLARRHPSWSLVLVGPESSLSDGDRRILREISTWSNVHCLGGKDVKVLAAYPQHFDVCIMPYLVTGYTNNIYPLKLHEYLAGGRPVVGSPIRSLLDFQDVILVPSSQQEWSDALTRSLAPPYTTEEARATRQAVARRNDWGELIFTIADLIAKGFGKDVATRLRKLDLR